MSYPDYPEVKDSGVEWLGKVPKHWGMKRLKFLADIRFSNVDKKIVSVEEPVFLCNYVDVYKNNEITDQLQFMEATASEPEIEAFRLQIGDVLITKDSESPDDIAIPAFVRESWKKLLCGYHLAMIRTLNSSPIQGKYIFYLFSSKSYRSQLESRANGITRFGLSQGVVKDCLTLVPPSEEQQAIAAFLDRKTAELDELIRLKEQQIELLSAKRLALISHAVTRGLDPSVKMRPSGIEWLGEIPAHWQVKQLKWAVTLQRGHDLTTDERIEGKVPVFTSSGLSGTHNVACAKGPGIVTGRYGTIGEFYLVHHDYWPINTTLYSINLHGNDVSFLFYMLTHLSPLFLLNAVKSAVPGVDRNDLHPTPTVVPPISEQRIIATFLDQKTAEIDKQVKLIETQIDKLRDYRQALISAAVTGKIDVRGVSV